MGWTQIVSDGLNRTSMIEPKSAELIASIEIKTRDLPGSTREQFGSAAVLIYINDLPNCYAVPRMFADDTSVSYATSSMNVYIVPIFLKINTILKKHLIFVVN